MSGTTITADCPSTGMSAKVAKAVMSQADAIRREDAMFEDPPRRHDYADSDGLWPGCPISSCVRSSIRTHRR